MATCEKIGTPGKYVPAEKRVIQERHLLYRDERLVLDDTHTMRVDRIEAHTEPGTVEYVLTLSEREAQILYHIMRNVSGSPTTSARKHTQAIEQGLSDCGCYKLPRPENLEGSISLYRVPA